MRSFIYSLALIILTSVTASADPVQSLYDLKVNSLDGKPVDLAQYKGHVTLVVMWPPIVDSPSSTPAWNNFTRTTRTKAFSFSPFHPTTSAVKSPSGG